MTDILIPTLKNQLYRILEQHPLIRSNRHDDRETFLNECGVAGLAAHLDTASDTYRFVRNLYKKLETLEKQGSSKGMACFLDHLKYDSVFEDSERSIIESCLTELKSEKQPVSDQHGAASDLDELAFIMKAAGAMLECRSMSDRDSRKTIVSLLPDSISQRIHRKNDAQGDVVEIIKACMAVDGGMIKLLEVIRYFEKEAICMQEVEEVMRECRP